MTRLFHVASAVLVSLFLASCGGDKPADGGSGPLTGGERLAWDQQAASVQELRSITYRLYIDGTLSAFTDVRCTETPTSAGYQCSGGLPTMTPGRHSLQVSSVLNGVESTRSEPLIIDVAGSIRQSAPVSAPEGADSQSRAPATACIETPGDECYGIRVVAGGIGAAHTLRSTPDGRLFFIEDGSRVRVVEGDRLLEEPAITFEDPGTHIAALAVDSQFSSTRSVYVAWTENDPAAGSVLNITRYRELAGAFGEGARIVTGLAFGDGGSTKQDPPYVATVTVPMAVDGEGLLYIAMPAAADPRAALSPSGTILRFTRDGLVPRGNRLSSPIVSEGFAQPTGLAIDVTRGRAWMTGHHPAWRHSVASFTAASNTTSSTSIPAGAADESKFKDPLAVVSMTLAQPAVPGETARLLIVAGKELYASVPSPDGRLTGLQRVRFDAHTDVLDAADGPNGSVYMLTSTDDRGTVLIKLAPR